MRNVHVITLRFQMFLMILWNLISHGICRLLYQKMSNFVKEAFLSEMVDPSPAPSFPNLCRLLYQLSFVFCKSWLRHLASSGCCGTTVPSCLKCHGQEGGTLGIRVPQHLQGWRLCPSCYVYFNNIWKAPFCPAWGLCPDQKLKHNPLQFWVVCLNLMSIGM